MFNLQPGSAYCQGCLNTFSILGSTGSNGLKPLVPQATGGIYAVVIVNQWVATGFMQVPRTNFGWAGTPVQTALAAGGISTNAQPVDTAEDFNRTTGTWNLTNGRLQSPVTLNQVRGRALNCHTETGGWGTPLKKSPRGAAGARHELVSAVCYCLCTLRREAHPCD